MIERIPRKDKQIKGAGTAGRQGLRPREAASGKAV